MSALANKCGACRRFGGSIGTSASQGGSETLDTEKGQLGSVWIACECVPAPGPPKECADRPVRTRPCAEGGPAP